MNRFIRLTIISLLMAFTFSVSADDLVVIVHKDNPTTTITRTQLIDLFMGKYVAFPNGELAKPADNEDTKTSFYKKLVNLSVARINAYWSRIKFTGRVRPPLEINSDASALNYVMHNPNAIAYIRKSALTDNVKVIYQLN